MRQENWIAADLLYSRIASFEEMVDKLTQVD
jgi:hypothetical protein